MKRFLLALGSLLMLAVSCNYFGMLDPDPDPADNPDNPSTTDPDNPGTVDVKPSISVEYTVSDSLRINNGDFAAWAYDTTGMYGLIVANTLLRKCNGNNQSLGTAMAKESGKKAPEWGYWNYIIHYSSTDGAGEEVILSERVVFPAGFDFTHSPKGIALISHPTIGAQRESPTIDKDFLIGLASLDYVTVFPDLMGFGVSRDRVHPYLCGVLTARQSIDGVLAALRFLDERGIAIQDGGGIVNVGYSQGGASALAIHKYIENSCTEEEKGFLDLKVSYCGGGPYDLVATWDAYKEAESLAVSCTLPMSVLAFKEAYPQEMNGIDPYDCLVESLREADYLNKRILSKEYTVSLQSAHLKLVTGSTRMSAILSPAMMDQQSELHATFRDLLERNSIASGWTPVKPVFFYHVKTDEVVPYVNMENALKGLAGSKVLTITGLSYTGGTHIGGAGAFYMQMMDEL